MMDAGLTPRPLISGPSELASYVGADMACFAVEQLRVLFLDSKRHLLADCVIAEGSGDEVRLALRAIVHRALDLGAAGLIVVHNHPSGDPEPRADDIAATRQLIGVCRPLEILVHDHLIVARGGWRSFRSEGLM